MLFFFSFFSFFFLFFLFFFFFEKRTLMQELGVRRKNRSFSELRTCRTRIRPGPFSELKTCRTKVWPCPFSELRACQGWEFGERTGLSLNSEPVEPGSGQVLSPNSKPAELRFGPVLSPNSEPARVGSSEKEPVFLGTPNLSNQDSARSFLRTQNLQN